MEPTNDPTDEPLDTWQYREIIKELLSQNKILRKELGELLKRTILLESGQREINARLNSSELTI